MVISLDHINKSTYWKCKCDCGNDCIIRGSNLMDKTKQNGGTKSCGCLKRKNGTNHNGYKGIGELSATLWNKIMWGAKRRNYEFSITMKDAWNLFLTQNRKCALTKLPLDLFRMERGKYLGNASLDRIDNSQGYVKGNIQWLHKDINMMKNDHKQSRFIELCKLVACQNQ